MKYLKQYIEEKIKIKVLGELTTRYSCEGEAVGVSLVIDGYEPGIEVWYADYANWLEEKYEELLSKENEVEIEFFFDDNDEIEKHNVKHITDEMTLSQFREHVLSAMEHKPYYWRDGQFVFNYIDDNWGVARPVQFIEGVDCFYDDNMIDEFIVRAYEYIKKSDSNNL